MIVFFVSMDVLTFSFEKEDGTTLNQYSEALYKVGINIKDSAGNLKDMDVILEEMGSKWDKLSRAQQTALA